VSVTRDGEDLQGGECSRDFLDWLARIGRRFLGLVDPDLVKSSNLSAVVGGP
jgi:hypothetical protein